MNKPEGNIKTPQMLVTPEYAKKLLATSADNRPINQSWVDGYARDMMEGRWYIGETLKIDSNGKCIDGHHRLHAVIKAGIPIWFLITQDLPPESVKGINMAHPWRDSQIPGPDGEHYSAHHFTIARVLGFGIVALQRTTGTVFLTYDEKIALIKKYEPALNFVVKQGIGRKYVSVIVMGVAARAFYSKDHDRISTFLDVLNSGLTYSNEDNAAIRLRNFMIDAPERGHRIDRAELYRRSETAMWHFCNRKPIGKLIPAKEELFPLTSKNGKIVPA